MKLALSLATLALVCTTTLSHGQAGVPEPNMSTVSPADALGGLFACPPRPVAHPASIVTVTIRDVFGVPVPGAVVAIVPAAGTLLVCPTAVLSGMTDAAGQVQLLAGMGGCAANMMWAGGLSANGIAIRRWASIKTPDWDGGAANGMVNLTDLVQFAREFNGLVPAVCHDYDNNGIVSLPDLILFAQAFSIGAHC